MTGGLGGAPCLRFGGVASALCLSLNFAALGTLLF